MSFLINPYAFLAAAGDFESIATVTVGSGGASSIEFTSIPGTYQHLQVRGITRVDTGTVHLGFGVRLNGVTTSSYAVHLLYGNGSAAGAGAAANNSHPYVLETIGASATANCFAAFVLDILDYADTSKNTTMRGFSASDANGSGQVRLGSGLYNATTAVTSVKLESISSLGLLQHSTAALYGIKAP